MNCRKARTRTLIQLGGLVEKSGLLELLEINTGDDLQKDPECFEAASILMGAFAEIYSQLLLDTTDAQKILWAERGKVALGRES